MGWVIAVSESERKLRVLDVEAAIEVGALLFVSHASQLTSVDRGVP